MRIDFKKVGLFLGPTLFFLMAFGIAPEGMNPSARAMLACTLWIAIWWITEPIPIPVTSLLPIVLFPLTGALGMADTTQAYGHPLVFLYVGGFIIAMAIERWDLHKRIAMHIIYRVGTNLPRIILGFMLATAVLSMWISNTATTVMMLPIGLAIIRHLGSSERSDFGKALMLSIAYAASIGGVATIIGTPTNLVFVGIVDKLYGEEIAFLDWFMFGLPISIVLLGLCWIYLTKFAFKLNTEERPSGRAEIAEQLKKLGTMTKPEKIVSVVFGLTAISWILRSVLLSSWLPGINDTIIAIAGATILFILPSGKRGEKLMNWETAVKIPWGIILLFGGGMALAAGFQESGLAEWIGNKMTLLQGVHLFLIILVLITVVNFLTELTSNVATASVILPILGTLAIAIQVHPYILMVAATLAASCAFMLPVATPPNAVVFGSGYLKISDMLKSGIWMNIISILFLTLMVYYFLPLIWQL